MSDSSLRSSFQQETWDITVELTGLLLKVERASSMDEPTRACFLRHLHSLKGAAVLVGESAAARLLHALEALFQQEGLNESCRDRRFFDAVLQTFDVLGQLASARPEGEPPPVEPLIERLFDLQVDGGESRQGLLARTYPGLLERHLEVLTDRQEERLLELGRTVCPLYAVEVSLPQDHLRAELAVCEKTLVETGEIVSCCGRGSAEDGRVRFWFLVATSRTADELRALMEPHGGVPIDLRIPPAATASRSGQTPDGRTDRGTDGAQTSPAPPELDRRASKPGGPDPTAPDVTQPASPPAPPVTERHQQPESVKAPSFDEVTQKLLDTCRNTYLAEFQEKVDDVGQWLEELRKRPDDPGLIDGIFRFGHSLKGTAGTLKFPALATLGATLEDVLSAIRDGRIRVTDGLCDLFSDWQSTLDRVRRELGSGTFDPSAPIPVVDRLRDVLRPRGVGAGGSTDAGSLPLGRSDRAGAATMQAPTSVAAREAADSIRVALAKIEAIINTSSELVNRKSRLGYLERELRRLLDQVHLVCRQFEETEESIRDEAMADPERLQIVDRLRPLVQALRTLEMATAGLCELGESVHFDVASLVDRLGNEAIRIRMVPLRQLFQKCPRMVRELGRKLGREVEFEYTGDDTEIDKVMLEQLEDPLVHMLRNAIDHGIEPPGDRLRAGKPPRGTIRLGASHRQGQVVIELSDDGAGMSAHDIGEKAAQVGLVTQERLREMSRDEVLGLIFAPGFSTRREVSEVSGRGVGMDVVRTNIGRLHGRVEIRTTVGQGSTFVLHLPLTLSIIHALVVVNGGATYCVPAGSILEALKVAPGVLEEIGGRTVMSHRGAVLPVATLAQVLGLPAGPLARDAVNLLVVAGARKRIGLLVDDIDCEEEIVIKPLGQLLRCVNNVSGATIRPRGDLAIVLDPDSLVTSANELWQAPTGAVVPRQAQPRIKTAHRSAVPTRAPILVVEDSVTSREMLVGILESAGFDVLWAVDGQHAWETLRAHPVRLVVTDVDMPSVDGFELTRRIKSDPNLAGIPVIFVTNLDEGGRRDPRQVQEASCLVQKRDFEQETLIRKIRELLGE